MANKIERQIDEIIAYVDQAKYVTFSSAEIRVNREELLDMLQELRDSTPDELAKYQRVVNDRDKIMDEAQRRAQQLIDEAQARTNQMVTDQEVMKQAYARANQIMAQAAQNAQETTDQAIIDANNYRLAAVQYMDNMLSTLEQQTKLCQEQTNAAYGQFSRMVEQYVEQLAGNREALRPEEQQLTGAISLGGNGDGRESGIAETATGSIPQSDNPLGRAGGFGTTASLNLDGVGR